MNDEWKLFLKEVDEELQPFVKSLHAFLLENGCEYEIKKAKSGFTLSYRYMDTKRTLAVYVFRKSGMKIKIYADHVSKYQDFLNELPEKMKKDIRKASDCKRMLDPNACNPRCLMGYAFQMEDCTYQKCRHMAFMPSLNDENNPYIERFLLQEINAH